MKLTRTGKRVHTSAEYNRRWLAANIAAGNCRDCKAPRVPGKARCQKCLDSHVVHSTKWRASVRAKTKNADALRAGAPYPEIPESQ